MLKKTSPESSPSHAVRRLSPPRHQQSAMAFVRVALVLACATSAAGFCAVPLVRRSPACAARAAARTELVTMKKAFLSRGSFRKWEQAAVRHLPLTEHHHLVPARTHSAVLVSDARRDERYDRPGRDWPHWHYPCRVFTWQRVDHDDGVRGPGIECGACHSLPDAAPIARSRHQA